MASGWRRLWNGLIMPTVRRIDTAEMRIIMPKLPTVSEAPGRGRPTWKRIGMDEFVAAEF